jgi:hypothetical protein
VAPKLSAWSGRKARTNYGLAAGVEVTDTPMDNQGAMDTYGE